jgi:hypothetical protein
MIVALIVAGVIIGTLIGIPIGRYTVRCPECPKCPEVVGVTERTVDASIERATVTAVVPRDTMKPMAHKAKPKPPAVAPALDPVVIGYPEETIVHYPEYNKLMPDSAFIKVDFATTDPPGKVNFYYTPSPKIKVREIQKTIQIPCDPCPPAKRFGWTVGPYAGIGIDANKQPVISAGVCISYGWRFK